MANPVGFKISTGADLATLYDTDNKNTADTEITTYKSQLGTYAGKDLGAIFTLYDGLAARGLQGTVGANCLYRNPTGVDIGSRFVLRGSVSSTVQETTVPFTPEHTTSLGLALWLDANDSTTITKDANNKVSAWYDKSGNGLHFVQTTTDNRPAYTASGQNSKAVISYTAANAQYMIGNSTANSFKVGAKSFAYFVVCRLNTGGVFNKSLYGDAQGRILLSKDTSLTMTLTHTGLVPGFTDNYTVANYRILSLVCNRNAPGNDKAYQNGSVMSSYTYAGGDIATDLANPYTFILGGYNNGSGNASPPQTGYYLEGAIAEVLMYSSATDMSDANRQKIEAYLAYKWGISLSADGHPYIATTTPTLVSTGLALWLDANDTNYITKNASNKVSAWKDKSGNVRDFVQATAGNQPTYTANAQNSKAVISFTKANSNYLIGNAAATSFGIGYNSFALFAVFKMNNLPNSNDGIIGKGTYAFQKGKFELYRDAATIYSTHYRDSSQTYKSFSDPYTTTANYRIVSLVSNRKTQGKDTIYHNGISVNEYNYTAESLIDSTNNSLMMVGTVPDGQGLNAYSYFLEGSIAEVLMYSNATDMSDTNRRNIEGYLASKWGISLVNGNSLTIAPTVTATVPLTVPNLYYPFNGNTINYGSNTGIGTIVNGNATCLVQTSTAKFGFGSFQNTSGGSSYFQFPSIPANQNGYTFSFWIYLTATTAGIVWSFQQAANVNNRIFCYLNGGILRFSIGTSTQSQIFTPTINTWYHIAWTCSKTSVNKVYVSTPGGSFGGVFNSTITQTYASLAFDKNYLLSDPYGATTSNTGAYGYIDEFFYYDQVLSDANILSLFSTNFNINSSNALSDITTSFINNLIPGVQPWGIYDASLWNTTLNVLPEARGLTSRIAASTGTITKVPLASATSGNGATAAVPYITGTTASTITWPAGSIPANFTICAITRYNTTTAGNQQRILTKNSSSGVDFIHGHHNSRRGFVYYGTTTKAGTTSIGTKTDWLVCCGNNGTAITGGYSVAGSVYLDNIPSGTVTGGTSASTVQMSINNLGFEPSDFAFTYLVIYDRAVLDQHMASLSQTLTNYLSTGTMTPSYPNLYLSNSAVTTSTLTIADSTTTVIVTTTSPAATGVSATSIFGNGSNLPTITSDIGAVTSQWDITKGIFTATTSGTYFVQINITQTGGIGNSILVYGPGVNSASQGTWYGQWCYYQIPGITNTTYLSSYYSFLTYMDVGASKNKICFANGLSGQTPIKYGNGFTNMTVTKLTGSQLPSLLIYHNSAVLYQNSLGTTPTGKNIGGSTDTTTIRFNTITATGGALDTQFSLTTAIFTAATAGTYFIKFNIYDGSGMNKKPKIQFSGTGVNSGLMNAQGVSQTAVLNITSSSSAETIKHCSLLTYMDANQTISLYNASAEGLVLVYYLLGHTTLTITRVSEAKLPTWYIYGSVAGAQGTTPANSIIGATSTTTGANFNSVSVISPALASDWNTSTATFTAPYAGNYFIQLNAYNSSPNISTTGAYDIQIRGTGVKTGTSQDKAQNCLCNMQASTDTSEMAYQWNTTYYMTQGQTIYFYNANATNSLVLNYGVGYTNLTITKLDYPNYRLAGLLPSIPTGCQGLYACKWVNTLYTGPILQLRLGVAANPVQDFYMDSTGTNIGTLLGGHGTSLANWIVANAGTYGTTILYVVKWYDQSPTGSTATGNTMEQTTTANQPTYSIAANNVVFNGTTHLLSNNNIVGTGNAPHTISTNVSGLSSRVNHTLFSLGSGTGTDNAIIAGVVNNASSIFEMSYDFNTDIITTNRGIALPTQMTATYDYSGTVRNGYFHKSASAVLTQTNNKLNIATTNVKSYLGYNFVDTTKNFIGSMNYLAVFNNALSYANRTIVESIDSTASFGAKSSNGCALWLDASDLATITKDGSNVVTLWNDKSGKGRNAVNAGTSNVTYNSTGFNNSPAIQFTSTGTSNNTSAGTALQAMKAPIPAATFSNGVTFFVVFQKTGTANTYEGLISRSDANLPAPFDVYNSVRSVGNTTSQGTFVSTLDVKTATTTTLYSGVVNTGLWNEYKNGTLQTKSSVTNVGNYADTAEFLYLGSRANNSTQFTGVMSEIVVYNSVLSDPDRQKVEGNLAWKWGINSLLPAGHSSSAPKFLDDFYEQQRVINGDFSVYNVVESNAVIISTPAGFGWIVVGNIRLDYTYYTFSTNPLGSNKYYAVAASGYISQTLYFKKGTRYLFLYLIGRGNPTGFYNVNHKLTATINTNPPITVIGPVSAITTSWVTHNEPFTILQSGFYDLKIDMTNTTGTDSRMLVTGIKIRDTSTG